jgi:hypothetical protein
LELSRPFGHLNAGTSPRSAQDEDAQTLPPFSTPPFPQDGQGHPHRLAGHTIPAWQLADRRYPVAVAQPAGIDPGGEVLGGVGGVVVQVADQAEQCR